MTRTDAWPLRSRVSTVLFPDFDGFAARTPLAVTRRPSVDSSSPPDGAWIGLGNVPLPVTWMSASPGRTSSWPYGSASFPATWRTEPRCGGVALSGSRTMIPPFASPMANRGSVPRRPASAVTVPRTTIRLPTGARRAAAGSRIAGVGLGVGLGRGVGFGPASGLAEVSATASVRGSRSGSATGRVSGWARASAWGLDRARAPRAPRQAWRGCDSRSSRCRCCRAARAGRSRPRTCRLAARGLPAHRVR